MSACKRGCCWNNWGVCGKNKRCPCHITQADKDRALEELREHQARLRHAAQLAGDRNPDINIGGQ
jgi:hypothetical protein